MNYYEILKVSKTASQQEIRDSYINLIKQYHPDIYKGSKEYAEKVTKELNDAYDILSVEEKRREYDLSLEPPTMQYTAPNYKTYTPPPEPKAEPKETIEDVMKKHIHKVVDEKISTMSKKSKTNMIIIIIIIALLFTMLAIQDYIHLFNLTQTRKQQQREIQRQILDEKFRKSFEENEQNIINI